MAFTTRSCYYDDFMLMYKAIRFGTKLLNVACRVAFVKSAWPWVLNFLKMRVIFNIAITLCIMFLLIDMYIAIYLLILSILGLYSDFSQDFYSRFVWISLHIEFVTMCLKSVFVFKMDPFLWNFPCSLFDCLISNDFL